MIAHIVLLRLRTDASAHQVTALRDGLLSLPASIREIRRLTFGPNLATGADQWPWVLMVWLDDLDALNRYANHPAHQDVLARLFAPIRQDRLAVDVEVPGD